MVTILVGQVFSMERKKELNVLIGANIKREREKAGYTQDQFSEMLGIGSKSLSAIERGVVGVSLTTLLKICEVLSVSSGTLLFEKNSSNDVQSIIEQLERLTPDQLEIVADVLNNLMKAFSQQETKAE